MISIIASYSFLAVFYSLTISFNFSISLSTKQLIVLLLESFGGSLLVTPSGSA
jgi:hypothetical protein